jgi:hypothetical protein
VRPDVRGLPVSALSTRSRRSARETTVHLTPGEITLLVDALNHTSTGSSPRPTSANNGNSTIEDGANEAVDAVRARIAKLEPSRR